MVSKKEKKEQVEIENEYSDVERVKENPVAQKYIKKPTLDMKDFEEIKKINYSTQVFIFRQRSLQKLSDTLKTNIPLTFTTSDIRKSSRLANLNPKERDDLVSKVRKSDANQLATNSVRRSNRIKNKLDGYVIN